MWPLLLCRAPAVYSEQKKVTRNGTLKSMTQPW